MSLIGKLTDYQNPNSIGSRLRRRRGIMLKTMIENVYQGQGNVRIIDIGGEASYWDIFPPGYLVSRKVRITLANKYEENLPPDVDTEIFDNQHVDCTDRLDYPGGYFDIAHSNSVIEHLLTWDNMKIFAKETRRIGISYFVQTPSFSFPFEPHFGRPFFHWLPESTRAGMLMRGNVGHYPQADSLDVAMHHVEYVRLLNRAQMEYLFPDATQVVSERVLGMTKSLVAIREA